jgi:hypothetical protein
MNNKNNILSYFIKDIKDPIERALYEQKNYNDDITIRYINELIRIQKNIKINYKIASYEKEKCLYCKHDKKISTINSNFISFRYKCKKYLVKTYFEYVIKSIILLFTNIKYFNGYKYKYIIKNSWIIKYTNNIILIMNKYELHYYNKFFNIYFGYK